MTFPKFIPDRSGVAAIEFALLTPLFIGLIFVIIEAGFLIFTQVGLEHGVESAARCAAVNTSACGDLASIQTYAASQTYVKSIPASAFSYIQDTCGKEVKANYTFTFFPSGYLGTSIPLSAQACFSN